jgi:magnesium chelatase family protein
MHGSSYSAVIHNTSVVPVEIQIEVSSRGLPGMTIVGLPGRAVRESRERIRSALRSSGYRLPSKKITVNLRPAAIPKQASPLDLATAIALLSAFQMIPPLQMNRLYIGELGVDGKVYPVQSCFALLSAAQTLGITEAVVSTSQSLSGAPNKLSVFTANTLQDVIQFIKGEQKNVVQIHPIFESPKKTLIEQFLHDYPQEPLLLRAMSITAVGNHHLALIGPPGSGKSRIAQALPYLTPLLTDVQWEKLQIKNSIACLEEKETTRFTPVIRVYPHHSLSSLIGTKRTVGLLELSRNGTLVLEEMQSYSTEMLIALRSLLDPIEIQGQQQRMIATINPCPCGYLGSRFQNCHCSNASISNYRKRLSPALLDRFDLVMYTEKQQVHSPPADILGEQLLQTIDEALKIQQKRNHGITNCHIRSMHDERLSLSTDAVRFLSTIESEKHFNYRQLLSLARVGRSIADLSGEKSVQTPHLLEACQYIQRDLWETRMKN